LIERNKKELGKRIIEKRGKDVIMKWLFSKLIVSIRI